MVCYWVELVFKAAIVWVIIHEKSIFKFCPRFISFLELQLLYGFLKSVFFTIYLSLFTGSLLQTKTKAQQLKAIRDYSFLFCDNAEIPIPDKGSTSDPKSATKSIPGKANFVIIEITPLFLSQKCIYESLKSFIFIGNVQQKQTIEKNSMGALKKSAASSKPIPYSKETKGINFRGCDYSRDIVV